MLRGVRIERFLNSFFGILIVIVWLMPVSTQRGVLNSGLSNRMYLCFFLLFSLMLFFDFKNFKITITRQIKLVGLGITILLVFSLLTYTTDNSILFGVKEFLTFFYMLLILGYRFKYVQATEFWRVIFYIISFIIVFAGFGMLLGNPHIWDFFGTYYVNHYSYVYEEFELLRKPVTFFAANSITCPIYFVMFFIWELCESKTHKILSIFFRLSFSILILGCFNNSAILCLGLIGLYYMINSSEKLSAKKLLIRVAIVITIIVFLMTNISYIESIIFSQANGILGRYSSSGAGTLRETIQYILDLNLPIGCTLVENLYITDSGLVVYTLRGSIIFTILVYYLLKSSMNFYMPYEFVSGFMCIALICFEIGYPILIAQRFMPLLLFFFLYVREFGDTQKKR